MIDKLIKKYETILNTLRENKKNKNITDFYNYNVDIKNAREYLKDLKLLKKQLTSPAVSKRCLADVEVEYKHSSGKVRGKLMYDDDKFSTLILKYDGGEINLPNIENCNVC